MLTEKFLLGRGREDLSTQEKQILEDSVAEVKSLPPRSIGAAVAPRSTLGGPYTTATPLFMRSISRRRRSR